MAVEVLVVNARTMLRVVVNAMQTVKTDNNMEACLEE